MGEGWGDFFATILRMSEKDTHDSNYGMGEYSAGRGIRRYKYSTSNSTNPSTYGFITKPECNLFDFISKDWEVHAKGEVWAEILYQVYWEVVDDYGFSPKWFDHPHGTPKSRGIHVSFKNRQKGKIW
jgi:extracellular elastinolytic metalloproteinase